MNRPADQQQLATSFSDAQSLMKPWVITTLCRALIMLLKQWLDVKLPIQQFQTKLIYSKSEHALMTARAWHLSETVNNRPARPALYADPSTVPLLASFHNCSSGCWAGQLVSSMLCLDKLNDVQRLTKLWCTPQCPQWHKSSRAGTERCGLTLQQVLVV